MNIVDRYGTPVRVGDRVRNVHRKLINCQYDPNYEGTVKSIQVEMLPLIEVDCGLEFLRYMPLMDLEVI